jgi:hypothetical protein
VSAAERVLSEAVGVNLRSVNLRSPGLRGVVEFGGVVELE